MTAFLVFVVLFTNHRLSSFLHQHHFHLVFGQVFGDDGGGR